MTDLINPEVVARMYREIARPRPTPQPANMPAAVKKPELTKADVDAVIRRARTASAEELQQILLREKEVSLTNVQRDQVALDLTLLK